LEAAEAAILDLRPMLEASTEETRELLQRLLRNSLLRVRQTEDGGYRLQGTGHLLVGAGAGDRTRPEHSTLRLAREIRIPLEL
jgi:hypothetical protein